MTKFEQAQDDLLKDAEHKLRSVDDLYDLITDNNPDDHIPALCNVLKMAGQYVCAKNEEKRLAQKGTVLFSEYTKACCDLSAAKECLLDDIEKMLDAFVDLSYKSIGGDEQARKNAETDY